MNALRSIYVLPLPGVLVLQLLYLRSAEPAQQEETISEERKPKREPKKENT